MLPPDFARADHAASARLNLHGEMIALVTPLGNGSARVTTNPMLTVVRHRLLASPERGREYVERWIALHEAAIREAYRGR